MKNLYILLNGTAGQTTIFTMRKATPPAAAANTALTCAIAAGATNCQDLNAAHATAISAGDTIDIATNNANPGQTVSWSVQFASP